MLRFEGNLFLRLKLFTHLEPFQVCASNKKAEPTWRTRPSAARPSSSRRPAAFRPHLAKGLALSES